MEEEINLRELIETLLRGKVIISVITVMAVLISGVLSFFVLTPTYQAKTSLMVNQPNIQSTESDNPISVLLDSLSQYPTMNLETIKAQIKNPEILQNVVDKLDFEEEMSPARFADKISVANVTNTNLLEISVIDTDPAKAAEIANILSQEFISFVNEQNKQRMGQSASILQTQMEIENEKLDIAVAEMQEFLARSPGVDELSAEIGSKLSMLTNFKTSMVNKELELEQLYAHSNKAKEEQASTPEVLIVKKSVIDDPLLAGLIRDTDGKDTASLSDISIETEEVNPVHINLTQIISSDNISMAQAKAELSGLEREIDVISRQLEELQKEYAEKITVHEQLEQKVDTLRSTYQSFANKYEETRIAATAEMGDNTVSIMASAQIPENPIAPRKMLNVAIAGVLGIMVGAFVVFFREFWINSDPNKTKLSA
ncbi:MAG: hypothetical protein APF76_16070 [Desulfitibacter sp. BRH_c19]|nr:MAG: hypothetical protein APF76_16070 [Desulfitibacter sp. BRH_c19]